MSNPLIYADIYTSMAIHPDTGQLLFKKNEQAIAQAIRNLIMTNRNEIPFSPDIGGSLSRLLFEPISPQVTLEIENAIRQTITEYEPRATITNVVVTPKESENAYLVVIMYYYDFSVSQSTVQFTLTRVR
jgi:phage baseplate assembly protein W